MAITLQEAKVGMADKVDQQVVDMCDGAIEIPQVGTKHSVNVSVAGGIVLWEFFVRLKSLLK